RSFTTGSPVPPLAPPDQDGPAKRPGSSLGSCHTRAEYTTPRCVRRSMSEKHSSKPAPTPFLMALTDEAPWMRALGTSPSDTRRAAAWRRAARVVAAYRDRYRITDDAPLGAPPVSEAQKIDAARAKVCLDRALSSATEMDRSEGFS